MQREHGDVVRLRIGPPGLDREMWMFHHPDAAARIFSGSTWRAFAKRDPMHDEIVRWLGTGLLTAEGEEWTRQRRFLQPLFTHPAVEGYSEHDGRGDPAGRGGVGRDRGCEHRPG